MNLMFIPLGGSSGPAGDVAQIIPNDFVTQGFSGTVFSGVKFDADGNIYERQTAGGWSSIGAWRLSGAASTFYVSRTIDTGSLTTDAGAGPLQMNTDRIYDIQRTSDGEDISRITFSISDDVSGSPVIANRTYMFNVIRGAL